MKMDLVELGLLTVDSRQDREGSDIAAVPRSVSACVNYSRCMASMLLPHSLT